MKNDWFGYTQEEYNQLNVNNIGDAVIYSEYSKNPKDSPYQFFRAFQKDIKQYDHGIIVDAESYRDSCRYLIERENKTREWYPNDYIISYKCFYWFISIKEEYDIYDKKLSDDIKKTCVDTIMACGNLSCGNGTCAMFGRCLTISEYRGY